jgi:hypothetical protein
MKKTFIFSLIAVVLLGAFVLYLILQKPSTSPTSTQTQTQNPYYSGGSSNATSVTPSPVGTTTTTASFTVTARFGPPIVVHDFRLDLQTATSSTIPGHYFISGGLDPWETEAPYSTFYVEKDQSFTVTLLQEPLAVTRKTAEANLMAKLNISQVDMCRLRYYISVPNDLNPIYAGKNLGFSFCPGATQL